MDRQEAFELDSGKYIEILITPEVIETDSDLKSLEFQDRLCYMEGEKKLKFFNDYSLRNCELECFSNHSIELCGCVPFDVIRASDTKVCSVYDNYCLQQLRFDLRYSNDNERIKPCNCFLLCDSVSYNFEVLESRLSDT